MSANYEWISDILYDEDISKLKERINEIEDPVALHIIAYNYNWDDGFEIPNLIINNENCDRGTALMIFDNAEGYTFFDRINDKESLSNKEWFSFVEYLHARICNQEFLCGSIQYTPELTKVQAYKLKKSNPDIPEIFIKGTLGLIVKIEI